MNSRSDGGHAVIGDRGTRGAEPEVNRAVTCDADRLGKTKVRMAKMATPRFDAVAMEEGVLRPSRARTQGDARSRRAIHSELAA